MREIIKTDYSVQIGRRREMKVEEIERRYYGSMERSRGSRSRLRVREETESDAPVPRRTREEIKHFHPWNALKG